MGKRRHAMRKCVINGNWSFGDEELVLRTLATTRGFSIAVSVSSVTRLEVAFRYRCIRGERCLRGPNGEGTFKEPELVVMDVVAGEKVSGR
jgi:hypothetical protein